MTDKGSPFQNTPGAILYEMAEDRDGYIYIGAYPDSRLFRFDPKTDTFTDMGAVVPGQFYSRSIVYDEEEHALYVGAGGNKASLVKIDLATGAKTEMLPEAYRSQYILTYDLNLVGDKLFLKMDPNFGLIVLDKKTGAVKDFGTLAIHSRGTSDLSPYENKVYLTYGGILKTYDLDTDTIEDVTTAAGRIDFKANTIGWGIVQLDDPDYPGYTLVGFNGNVGGQFFKYNLVNKTLRITNIQYPKVAVKLHTLGAGNDGKIYAGAFLPGGMGIFNPDDNSSTSNTIGQTEGMTALGKYMYFGVYGGSVYEYDTTQPWRINTTVVRKIDLKPYEQDRPYAMIGVPEQNRVYIGTVPNYAVSGGALTVYDPAAPAGSNFRVYRNIVQDQSVVALAYKDGKIYGGTSYAGGLGESWPYADGRLFVFDAATEQKEYEIVPVPGKGTVNALIAGPDGNIWGFAQGTFFIFDPAQKKVIHTENAFPQSTATWRDPQMGINVKDGHVYGTIAGKFFKIDKDTQQITVLLDGASLFTQDKYGNMYFNMAEDEASLYRYTVEDNTIKVNGIALNKTQLRLNAGQVETLVATVYPEFASRKAVVWSSSNSSVATVNASGAVTAVAPGTAVITATTVDGNFTASAVVRVD